MDRHHYGNYEAFKALHEARMQQVRASAEAAALTRRNANGLIRRISTWLGSRQSPATPDTTAQSFFWT